MNRKQKKNTSHRHNRCILEFFNMKKANKKTKHEDNETKKT